MQTRELTDRIRFLDYVVSYSAKTGAEVTTWSELQHDTPCSVLVVSGKTAISSGDLWMTQTISVKCRYAKYIDERMRLKWNGVLYRIESCVATSNAYGEREIQIVAQRVDE